MLKIETLQLLFELIIELIERSLTESGELAGLSVKNRSGLRIHV